MPLPRRRRLSAAATVVSLAAIGAVAAGPAGAATFTVTNTGNSGTGSLAQAILDANAAGGSNVINFTPGLGTISGYILPSITGNLTIDGPATVDGQGIDQVFTIGTSGVVAMNGLTIQGGRDADGAAITNAGTLTLRGSDVVSNTGDAIGNSGPLQDQADLTVIDSVIQSNDGAGISNSGILTVANSLVANNTLTGIDTAGSSPQSVTNSTITGNGWEGVYVNSGTLTVRNSTISSNQGYGIRSFGSLVITSTILADNAPADCLLPGSGTATWTRSLVEDGSCNAASGTAMVTGEDPGLQALANNGGPTRTQAITGASPAIDKGSNPLGLTTDQRGGAFRRTVGAATDIGAFELNRAPTAAISGPSESITGQQVEFTSSSTDPDGDTLTNTWTITGPGGTDSTSSGASAGFTPTVPGEYAVSLRVSDGQFSDTESVALTVTPPPDTTSPTVTIEQASGQADPTDIAPVRFTVVFSEPVSGFTASDVLLSGTAGATTATVAESGPMDGTTYTVAAWNMTRDGTVIASVAAGAASDAAGNPSEASTSEDHTVTFVVNEPPTAVFSGPSGSYTGQEVTFTSASTDPDGDTLTHLWSITGPGGTDFSSSSSIASFTPTVPGEYTIRLRVSDGLFVDSETRTLTVTVPPDTTDPTVTINQASDQADPTPTSPVRFTAVFSEPVTGFGPTDVVLSGTAGATTATVTESGPMDGTTYTVSASGMTGNGTVIASVTAGAASDAAGNPSDASTSTDPTVTYTVAPALTFSVADITTAERNSQWTLKVPVCLSGVPTKAAAVKVKTAAGTAKNGSDFAWLDTRVAWSAGQAACKSVSITIKGDRTREADERFTVGLSYVYGAPVSRTPATITLRNDD